MQFSLRQAIGDALASTVQRTAPVGGGDINEAWHLWLADGREVFAKTNGRPPAGLFPAEARGLAWLAEPGVVAVPDVLASDERFLVLPWLEPGPRAPDFDERLGRELAALHQFGAPSFGLDRANFLATIRQDNTQEPDWPTFFERRRLRPLVELAVAQGDLGPKHQSAFDQLYPRLQSLWGEPEPPARLHGDLWGGNLHASEGAPALIDPAVFGGHREIDLGMMRLFGGFSARTFAAYDEAYPLSSGADDRLPLAQLIPLLAHVVLFGGGYVASVERVLRHYVG